MVMESKTNPMSGGFSLCQHEKSQNNFISIYTSWHSPPWISSSNRLPSISTKIFHEQQVSSVNPCNSQWYRLLSQNKYFYCLKWFLLWFELAESIRSEIVVMVEVGNMLRIPGILQNLLSLCQLVFLLQQKWLWMVFIFFTPNFQPSHQ